MCPWLKVDWTLYRVRTYTWQLAQVFENAATEGQSSATSCSQSGLRSRLRERTLPREQKKWVNQRGHWVFTKSTKWFTRRVNVVFNHLLNGAHFSWFYIEWMLGINIGPSSNLLMVLYKHQTALKMFTVTRCKKKVWTPQAWNINRNTLESGSVLTFEQLKVARVIQGMGGKLLMSSTRNL